MRTCNRGSVKLEETAPELLNDSKYSLFVGDNFDGKAKRIEDGAIRERHAEENLFIVAGLGEDRVGATMSASENGFCEGSIIKFVFPVIGSCPASAVRYDTGLMD